MSKSKTILLVHGAFADSHAFDAVVPLLKRAGHTVLAPDLPGHGRDQTPLAQISLARYTDAIAALVEAQPNPVVLVGHSMAGMIISGVAERLPEKVSLLVYVAAYLPQHGQSISALAQNDSESLVGQNMVFAPDYSTVTIRPERVAEAICADVPAEIQALIVAGQKPEPLAPFQGEVSLSAARFGRVPKVYLATQADRAVTPGLQQTMLAAYPGIRSASLPTGHLPFVSRPEEFSAQLLSWAQES